MQDVHSPVSPACPSGLPCWEEGDCLSERAVLGLLAFPCYPRIEFLAQWGAAGFYSHFLALSGLLGAGIRSQAQPLQIAGEGECGRFPSWGKRQIMQLEGEKIKQSSFSSLLAQSEV